MDMIGQIQDLEETNEKLYSDVCKLRSLVRDLRREIVDRDEWYKPTAPLYEKIDNVMKETEI